MLIRPLSSIDSNNKKMEIGISTAEQGTFVLTDNKFRWLSRLSTEPERRPELQAYLTDYLAFPTGIIRGESGGPCI